MLMAYTDALALTQEWLRDGWAEIAEMRRRHAPAASVAEALALADGYKRAAERLRASPTSVICDRPARR